MPESHADQLNNVFCGVMENLAFMFGDLTPKEELPDSLASCAEAHIRFDGPTRGSLVLMAPASIASELAMNVLGLDSDDGTDEETAADALAELMNVTLGQLLTAIHGDEPVYNLTVPEVNMEAGADAWRDMIEAADSVAFIVDEHPILLRLSVEQETKSP